MKKPFILLAAMILAACAAPAAQTQSEPIVVTVVVEPTQQAAAPVEPTQVVVTVVVDSQPSPTTEPVEDSGGDGAISLSNDLGRGVFVNMTMSSSNFTLRCFPRDITFNITSANKDIKDVIFYYRIVDDERLYPSEWRAFGEMNGDGDGNFSLTFKGEDIHPDLRVDGSWLDFQFVGLAKSGDVVDRSQKIESMVSYTFDCP